MINDFLIGIIFVFLLHFVLIIFNKYSCWQNKTERCILHLLNNILNKDIVRSSFHKNDDKKQEDEYQNIISEVQRNHAYMLYSGKILYNKLKANETVVLWSKCDFANLIEYYKLIDLPFISHLETDYERLTPRNILFAILSHMNKTDEEIGTILAITQSTVRSNRSRIKSKSKKNNS